VSVLRKTVAVLARLGAELQAQRTAERSKLAAAPEEVKVARISPGLIKKLRARLGITQGELATLVGVSTSAVGFWEYGKAKPEGRNREALVALRKLGKREVRGILAAKAEEVRQEVREKAEGRRPEEATVISRRFRAGG
jgi:DNA-binding transcriptional regulator YiaG